MKSLPFLLILILTGCSKDPFLKDDQGAFKDMRDNHEYKWVRIGEQLWMAENLAYLPSVSPSSEGSETAPFYYIYGYEGSSVNDAKASVNFTTYGVLYNWEAAKVACPVSWHLPTDSEWKVLETYLGMSPSDADRNGYRAGGSIGKALKSASGWNDNGNGDNSSGFAAVPGGGRYGNGSFANLGTDALFWSFSEEEASLAWYRNLFNGNDGVFRVYEYQKIGFSVRCVKD